MTKLERVMERIRQLPPEEQETLAAEIEFRLEQEERGSVLTDEQWAEIEPTLDDDDEEIPHEKVMADIRAQHPK
jgi:hypothetical protein